MRSRLKLPKSFKCESGNVAEYCQAVEEDIRLGSLLSPATYRLVRYEDLTEDPLGVMTDLYNFIGVNLTKVILQKINDHFHAENMTRQIRQVVLYRRCLETVLAF